MPLISLFTGLAPRLPEHAKAPGMASEARDVDLRAGTLRPWRERRLVADVGADVVSCWCEGGRMLTWYACVDTAYYLPDYQRLYVTGRRELPEAADLSEDPPGYTFLGVPGPDAPPSAGGGGGGTDAESDARSYVYTWVNKYGEESAPSPPSAQITCRDGDAVSVSTAAPPAGYGIVAANVYRTASGTRKSPEDMQTPATVWSYAGTASPGGTLSDGLLLKELGRALGTADVHMPPDGLRAVRHVEGTAHLAGVAANRLFFSRARQPWNWPLEAEMTFRHHVVNMTSVGGTVFITTDANAYVVEGPLSCGPGLKERQVWKVPQPVPDLGCGRPHSAVPTPFGMAYSSPLGLALVKASTSMYRTEAAFEILTAPWYTQEEWNRLRPDTARLAFWRGLLFCITDAASLVLGIDPKTYGDGETGTLSTISDRPDDLWTTSGGELLMLEGGRVWQWDAGDSFRPFAWESADLRVEGRSTPSWAKVRTSGARFRLWPSGPFGRRDEYETAVTGPRPFRLPRMGRHEVYRVGLYGTGQVDSVRLDNGMYVTGEER
jgi:hypothetical protein